MSDIVAFIEARLDERQHTANAAANAGHWRDLAWPESHGITGTTEEHILAHSPRAVLADIAAKRRILARHCRAEQPNYMSRPTGPVTYVCVGCGYTGDCDDPRTDDINECPELRDLAAPYADHPDYDPAWKCDPAWKAEDDDE